MFRFKHSLKLAMLAGLALASVAVASRAHAGLKIYNAVVIGPVLGTTHWAAQGAMGTARNSPNLTDYIGCTFSVSNSSGQWDAHCDASAAGVNAACNVPPLDFDLFIESMRNMTADSVVRFEWDPATGLCTRLQVWASSTAEPKLL
jgi:hypothetical protein